MAEFRGRLENLLHQPPRQRPQALVGHDDVGRHAAGRDGETVERHVPDKFFPAQFLEIVLGLALDAGFGKQLRDLACAGLRGPAEFTEHHQAGKGAMHNPGRGARAADEADGPEHMLAAHHLGHGLLDAEAVLQRQHQRAGPHQRRQDLCERGVGGGFHADDDQIARADVRGGGVGRHFLEVDAVARRFNPYAAGHHGRPAAAHQEMDIVARLGEPGAIVTAQRAGTDDRDAGVFRKWSAHNASVVTKIGKKYNPAVEWPNRSAPVFLHMHYSPVRNPPESPSGRAVAQWLRPDSPGVCRVTTSARFHQSPVW